MSFSQQVFGGLFAHEKFAAVRSGKGRAQPENYAARDIGKECVVESLSEQADSLVAEGGECGEASAYAGCKEKLRFGGKIETPGQGIEQSDKEAACQVYGECAPWERTGRDASGKQQLDGIPQHAADASSQKNHQHQFGHISFSV